MKKYILSGIGVAIGLALIYPMIMLAKPHKVDGEYYAKGRVPQEIKDNIYPRSYFPRQFLHYNLP